MILTIAMAHPRKLIRHAVAALLAGAGTAAGARVKPTRTEPHRTLGSLPAISVYTLHDPVDSASGQTAPVELKHDLQLEIAAWVVDSDSYPADDAMDDIAEQIEAAMDIDVYLGGTAGDSQLAESVMQVVEYDSDPRVGIVTLTYNVTYRKSPAVVGGDIQDFLTADAKHELVGRVGDTPVAEDTFTVQETP